MDNFCREISFLEKIKLQPHPNIIKYFGYFIVREERND